jgi:hypothetical protein
VLRGRYDSGQSSAIGRCPLTTVHPGLAARAG